MLQRWFPPVIYQLHTPFGVAQKIRAMLLWYRRLQPAQRPGSFECIILSRESSQFEQPSIRHHVLKPRLASPPSCRSSIAVKSTRTLPSAGALRLMPAACPFVQHASANVLPSVHSWAWIGSVADLLLRAARSNSASSADIAFCKSSGNF